MNQKKGSINKINRQINGNLKKKNNYKENGYNYSNNKKVFKFMNDLKYTNYNNIDDINSDKNSSSSRNEENYNINNNKNKNQYDKKEDDAEEEEGDEDDEETNSSELSNFSPNKKNKENLDYKNYCFYNDFDDSKNSTNKKSKVNLKNYNSDYYDIYSNIYSYYDIFTEDKNEKKKFKYFNDVFSNFDRKYENNEFNYDANMNKKLSEKYLSSQKKRNNFNKNYNKENINENNINFINENIYNEYYTSSNEVSSKKNVNKNFMNMEYPNKRKTKKKKKKKNTSDISINEEKLNFNDFKKNDMNNVGNYYTNNFSGIKNNNFSKEKNKEFNYSDDFLKKKKSRISDNENSEISSYLYGKYSKMKENKKMKNVFKEKSASNISLDSSCSFELDFFHDKEKTSDMKKCKKFLKNPTRKRMYKLKKIIEILEYSIYNEEKEGAKLESKLYEYVLLTKSLKQKISNLEELNNTNKNKMTSYEKDISKLKEQNEEMKLTLSTFENELSNLINKFDKNFAKELIDTKSQNDILKKEVERLKMEVEKKNYEIKKIENLNDITKKNNNESFITNNNNANNISNGESNEKIDGNLTNNKTINTKSNCQDINEKNKEVTIYEFPYYNGNSEMIDLNIIDDFISKMKTMRMTFEKNIEKYDEETKSLIYGCYISNFLLENKDICNHKKVLKQLQEFCISESKILSIHMCLKKERSDLPIKQLEKEIIKQLEDSDLDKNKDRACMINSIILLLIFKNMHIFNLYKIFITSLKYDNFRWIRIIKKALFLKFFDLCLIDTNMKINEMQNQKEAKLININVNDSNTNENINYNIKHPLFYCANDTLKNFVTTMYLNFSKDPINPQNNDNIYHYVLQQRNLDVLKILKLSGKNYNYIFNKNSENKTPLDYIDNEDIKIDLISGYILDIAGKGAENYKNSKYEVAYDLYTEALEKQIKLSESVKMGKSMNENIGKLYYNRARTLMHLNKWIDVIENCNNCLKYIPKYVNAFDTQIQAYENLLEYENALLTYKNMCIKCNIKPDEKEEKLKSQINATCFQILNINKNCNVAEIKQAFSNLSKKWHPDKLGINISADIKKRHNNHFKRLFKAKQLLLNDIERQKEKKKKETNYIYPQIIEDIKFSNNNNKKNNMNDKESNKNNYNKEEKKNDTYETSYNTCHKNINTTNFSKINQNNNNNNNTDKNFYNKNNNNTNMNDSKSNIYNSYKDDIDKFQEKLKNLNKGNNDNENNKFFNPFPNIFDNKFSNLNNEKIDENFYKKLKEEYEGLSDDELNNLKTKLSNSINNLIQTEINSKREYQELCIKEKTNVIMNARLCILQEIQKALCVRLDKERKLKVIENILKNRNDERSANINKTNSFSKKNDTEEVYEESNNTDKKQNNNYSNIDDRFNIKRSTFENEEIDQQKKEDKNIEVEQEEKKKSREDYKDEKSCEEKKEDEELENNCEKKGCVDDDDNYDNENEEYEEEFGETDEAEQKDNNSNIPYYQEEKDSNNEEDKKKRNKERETFDDEQKKKKVINDYGNSKESKKNKKIKEFKNNNMEDQDKMNELNKIKMDESRSTNSENFKYIDEKNIYHENKEMYEDFQGTEKNNNFFTNITKQLNQPFKYVSVLIKNKKLNENEKNSNENLSEDNFIFINNNNKKESSNSNNNLFYNLNNENFYQEDINEKEGTKNECIISNNKTFEKAINKKGGNNFVHNINYDNKTDSSNNNKKEESSQSPLSEEYNYENFTKNMETEDADNSNKMNSINEDSFYKKKFNINENIIMFPNKNDYFQDNNTIKNDKNFKIGFPNENINEDYFENNSFINLNSSNLHFFDKKQPFKINEKKFYQNEDKEEENINNEDNLINFDNFVKKEERLSSSRISGNNFANKNIDKNNLFNRIISNSSSNLNDSYSEKFTEKHLIYSNDNFNKEKKINKVKDTNIKYTSDNEVINNEKFFNLYNEKKKMNTYESSFFNQNLLSPDSSNNRSNFEKNTSKKKDENAVSFLNYDNKFDNYKNKEANNIYKVDNSNDIKDEKNFNINLNESENNLYQNDNDTINEKLNNNVDSFIYDENKFLNNTSNFYNLNKSYNYETKKFRNSMIFLNENENESENKNIKKMFSGELNSISLNKTFDQKNKFPFIENLEKLKYKNIKGKVKKDENEVIKLKKSCLDKMNTKIELERNKKNESKENGLLKKNSKKNYNDDKQKNVDHSRKSKLKTKDKQ
ncbi:conserved Plasmodium protein, unknown function [Plasmodium relictum]|uniref:J domain-containing protein n=1 Tax=Plasmodium relictum TaxID=85471 RepID=A0A1J1H6A7_PLARL|nr:conserved Plasmodium protein, unknown function [Plasmodium relictum]CRH00292.1 conserved Plasmodium protein, unknown function [Plasmodium relictum]